MPQPTPACTAPLRVALAVKIIHDQSAGARPDPSRQPPGSRLRRAVCADNNGAAGRGWWPWRREKTPPAGSCGAASWLHQIGRLAVSAASSLSRAAGRRPRSGAAKSRDRSGGGTNGGANSTSQAAEPAAAIPGRATCPACSACAGRGLEPPDGCAKSSPPLHRTRLMVPRHAHSAGMPSAKKRP